MVILDAITGIVLEDEQEERYFNEIGRIEQLRVGLGYLYHNVLKIEQLHPPDPARIMDVLGPDPDNPLPPGTLELVNCSFHWYAVSLCSHCGLVGKIAEQVIPERMDEWRSYRRKIGGPVLMYRNKIAAHFALVNPKTTEPNADNPADASRSTLYDLTFADGRFTVGGWNLGLTTSGQHSRSKHKYWWSLTATHESLGERYGW